ncbi:MAG: hypothetical protein OH319_04285 [Candidatus Parvarchaeota archaeon]|nr:hypothetical protein [Candidatus Jingweiarchaeum tengchongense]MCW1297997.1 hypothetical protein [Candidatus Jingweiarchaeum tengchongense]MCW1300062.1 hypothetical protein [Candidatus Jingweiarchaeum tengchongense]MCW1304413.1 hypothetical protein [Candidatus Jingweiarchaeum tengchongense]MCW1305963.1 hypothetical protein [Candidatus Jingweiarchaeum tengchongense]
MGIEEKLRKEGSELKILMGRGIVKFVFKDGSEYEILEKEGEKILIGGITHEKMNVLKDEIASRLFYMLMLRPYNKFGIASTYYQRKKNIARRVIDEAIEKLEKNGFINEVEWNEIFKKKYKITGKSKYVYVADLSNLFFYLLAEDGEIIPEYYFFMLLFKVLNPNELFFEWSVSNIREEEVDILRLIKMKLLYLLSISLYLKTKYQEAWSPIASLYSQNFRVVIRKLMLAFRFIDYVAPISYFLSILEGEVPEIMVDEASSIVTKYYGENKSILSLIIFFMYWPSELIIDFLDKIALK